MFSSSIVSRLMFIGVIASALFLNSAKAQEVNSDSSVYLRNSWGAIAVSENYKYTSHFVGAPSKRKANAVALEECKTKNGSECKVWLSFFNQCAAITSNNEGKLAGDSARTREAAEELALKSCNKYSDHCKLEYSVCSEPYAVK